VNLVKEKEKLGNSKTNKCFVASSDQQKSKIRFKNKSDKEIEKTQYIDDVNVNNEININDNLIKKQKIYDKFNSNYVIHHNEEDKVFKDNSLVDFDTKKIKNKVDTRFVSNSSISLNVSLGLNINTSNVKQSYDKKLSEIEKQALESTIIEEKDYKCKLELLKRKKNLEREERLERIKKMRIE